MGKYPMLWYQKTCEHLLMENLNNKIDLVFPIRKRTMRDSIHKIRKQVGIKEAITLQDLRYFWERQNREGMLELFRGNSFLRFSGNEQ